MRSCRNQHGLSAAHLILLTVRDAEQPISMSDLVVQSWKLSPETFGLRGYETVHPNSTEVRCRIYGQRGLVAEGYLVGTAVKGYSITAKGLRFLENVGTSASESPKFNRKVARPHPNSWAEQGEALDRLFRSSLFKNWMASGRLARQSETRQLDLSLLSRGCRSAKLVMRRTNDDFVVLPNGRHVTAEEFKGVLTLLGHLSMQPLITSEKR